ncbi:hypothetical protein SKAU_G00343210 [Synaphobranchus kaupii]|uniref:Uncharacterized protein n=1 Tax=Synaphobranchus kaupii TaxID=118154 RepID=A0A9Q1IFA3_SYNKA|nr:hypothetical protein SKAU_G00343210 [Synaphobranchus kaupii]
MPQLCNSTVQRRPTSTEVARENVCGAHAAAAYPLFKSKAANNSVQTTSAKLFLPFPQKAPGCQQLRNWGRVRQEEDTDLPVPTITPNVLWRSHCRDERVALDLDHLREDSVWNSWSTLPTFPRAPLWPACSQGPFKGTCRPALLLPDQSPFTGQNLSGALKASGPCDLTAARFEPEARRRAF